MNKILTAALAVAVILAMSGCSGESGPSRHAVSGTVTLEGKPVTNGAITLEPDASAQNTGPQGYATIENGAFDTAKGGQGVVGGPHVATITGSAGPDPKKPGNELYIDHRMKVDLPKDASTQTFEVPASGAKSQPKSPEA